MRIVKTPDFPLLDSPGQTPLTRQDQVYRSLRHAVAQGLLARGMQVPSTRELAARWGLSRGTVEQAYERLVIEGYLVRRRGAGTFVAVSLPEHFLLPDTPCRIPRTAALPAGKPLPEPAEQSYCGSTLRAGQAFASPLADPALLDRDVWRRHLIAATRSIRIGDMHQMSGGGLEALREAIAAYVKSMRGIDCRAEDIVVTTGIRQSLSIISSMLRAPANVIHVEDPSYVLGRRVFESRHLDVRPTPMDGEGLRVDLLAPSGVAAVYLTPAHQAPTGVTMSAARRAAVLEWARACGALIVEDDYDSDYSYLKSPPPALKSSDVHDQVVFCGSFNKVLYSSLRIGFMIPPRSWRDDIVRQLNATGAEPGLIEQQAMASMIASGDIYSHIRQSRRVYERRRNIVLSALSRWLDKPRLSGEHGGFRFLLWLPPGLDDRAVSRELEGLGIAVPPLSDYASLEGVGPGLVIAYASVPDEVLRDAAERLGHYLATRLGLGSAVARTQRLPCV
ncbi:PLP-dependent aminotransferase family protein [Paludibacterium yongneupense]|uniref:MocR-like pyridoxine biosynthesis transcription factor PdxR n=1 Tax=Paludibacterium yongneupense TaxID=400061 RepID=UPI000415AE22|nr:PLP-dependent aminotransferase family protein [Paludibacterium yongneupense]